MPLQMEFTHNETTYSNGYLIIPSISVNSNNAYIFLNWFENKSSYESGYTYINQTVYAVETSYFDSGNVIALAYEYIKALPEFSTAVEVL